MGDLNAIKASFLVRAIAQAFLIQGRSSSKLIKTTNFPLLTSVVYTQKKYW